MKVGARVVAAWWIAASAVVGGARVSSAEEFPGSAKVDPPVLQELARRGEATYLVYLREQAALAPARQIGDWNARGRFVHRALRAAADRGQRPLLARLAAEVSAGRAKEVQSFFSVNAVVVTSSEATLETVAALSEVEAIELAPVIRIPEPMPGVEEPLFEGSEWNIAQIRAPEVWAQGVRGQGIVVADIDTGVQSDHPALAKQYRGNLGGGVVDHNYNWWDPSKVCGNPSRVPCDNDGHGTHTMGIMVGDDGGTNRIGVAPRARWMACKGCESSSCSVRALLECGDFVLAPWNLNKTNADPSKRPHVVNNSWGGDGGDLWYQRVVRSWRAAGIFPAFSIGNGGSGCSTAGSPGDYAESFATGATDIDDAIPYFSARGPSFFGVRKPDIAAPGVNIRSSVPSNAYTSLSGTSMASPHTAGLVALLWSAYPGLNRDVPNTEKKLRPAADILDSTERCGGDGPTTHPNNAFGWGREDAAQALAPFNIYTDRSTYYPGDTMNVFVSLVNPRPVTVNVDVYVVLAHPDGLLFFPSFGTTPVPWLRNLAMPPLLEVFDVKIFGHRFAGEFPGTAAWLAVLTPPGADLFDPAAQLSVDRAIVTKN